MAGTDGAAEPMMIKRWSRLAAGCILDDLEDSS